jgi:hypothetical protein
VWVTINFPHTFVGQGFGELISPKGLVFQNAPLSTGFLVDYLMMLLMESCPYFIKYGEIIIFSPFDFTFTLQIQFFPFIG